MRPSHLERIDNLPDIFMLASLVQFKYIQTISTSNDTNFKVGAVGERGDACIAIDGGNL